MLKVLVNLFIVKLYAQNNIFRTVTYPHQKKSLEKVDGGKT